MCRRSAGRDDSYVYLLCGIVSAALTECTSASPPSARSLLLYLIVIISACSSIVVVTGGGAGLSMSGETLGMLHFYITFQEGTNHEVHSDGWVSPVGSKYAPGRLVIWSVPYGNKVCDESLAKVTTLIIGACCNVFSGVSPVTNHINGRFYEVAFALTLECAKTAWSKHIVRQTMSCEIRRRHTLIMSIRGPVVHQVLLVTARP
jgi:hypothetical protein